MKTVLARIATPRRAISNERSTNSSARRKGGLVITEAEWPVAQSALRAALSYEARERCFARRIGLRAAERAYRDAIDAVDDLSRDILGADAHSSAGLAVQARAIKVWGKPEWWSEEDHADAYERFAAHVIDRMMAMVS